jgi:sugar (pentulose or hexulose) kinase
LGLSLATSPLDLLQAALEAVAQRFAMIWALLREAVPSVREIVSSGGALRHSPAWTQMLADVLGHDILASDEPEGSSRGAARVALEVLGAPPPPVETAPRRYAADPERHRAYRLARERQVRLEEALAPLQRWFLPPDLRATDIG